MTGIVDFLKSFTISACDYVIILFGILTKRFDCICADFEYEVII